MDKTGPVTRKGWKAEGRVRRHNNLYTRDSAVECTDLQHLSSQVGVRSPDTGPSTRGEQHGACRGGDRCADIAVV